MITTDPTDPELGRGVDSVPVQQNKKYLVLSEEDRSKGFIRPVRKSYVHVGKKVDMDGIILPIPEDDKEYYNEEKGFVAYLEYSKDRRPLLGKIVSKEEMDAFKSGKTHYGGCGSSTRMADAIAETYATNPGFYGATYCVVCSRHLPVGEFLWEGTDDPVGS